MLNLQAQGKMPMHLERWQPVRHRPGAKGIGRLGGDERGRLQSIRLEAPRAGPEEVQTKAGIVMGIEVVASHKMRRIRLVVHDGVDVVDVIAHVYLNSKPLGVKGHERLLIARKPHVEADAVRTNLPEKGKVPVGNPKLVEDPGVAVENHLKTKLMRTRIYLREVAHDILAAVLHREQAAEDAGEARRRSPLQIVQQLFAIALLGINRDSKTLHASLLVSD